MRHVRVGRAAKLVVKEEDAIRNRAAVRLRHVAHGKHPIARVNGRGKIRPVLTRTIVKKPIVKLFQPNRDGLALEVPHEPAVFVQEEAALAVLDQAVRLDAKPKNARIGPFADSSARKGRR